MSNFEQLQISIMTRLTELSHRKLVCTGLRLETPTAELWPKCSFTEPEFDGLVTFFYTNLVESWKVDVSFLNSAAPSTAGEVENALVLLQKLRTARQHNDNIPQIRFRQRWIEKAIQQDPDRSEWEACAVALLEIIADGVSILCKAAESVASTEELRGRWRELASVTPLAVVTNVAEELGLTFSRGNFSRIARSVEYRFQQTGGASAEGDLRSRLEALAECELIGRVERLPFPYREILNYLAVAKGHPATAALRLAHVVHEVSGLNGRELLTRVAETWIVANTGPQRM